MHGVGDVENVFVQLCISSGFLVDAAQIKRLHLLYKSIR